MLTSDNKVFNTSFEKKMTKEFENFHFRNVSEFMHLGIFAEQCFNLYNSIIIDIAVVMADVTRNKQYDNEVFHQQKLRYGKNNDYVR